MDMRPYARHRQRGTVTWFELGLALFAAALPIGLVLMLVAPVAAFHALGAVIVGTGLIGMWVSALGLQLEYPERWIALKASIRRFATAPSPPRRMAER
jgi:hypothetical protein